MATKDNKQEKPEIEFELTKFDPKSIVDFSEWEKRQQQTLAENPFIEVVDNETWEIGKQRRTALRTARTTLQNERDDVKKELNNIKTFVVNKYDEFIDITAPAENKQQETVKSFEAEKEAEKQRQADLEQQRLDDIRRRIDEIEGQLDAITLKMTFETSDPSANEFDDIVMDGEQQQFDELEFLFNEMIARQKEKFHQRSIDLVESEKRRVEQLKVTQQSMINEMYRQANEAIDGADESNADELKNAIDKIFTTEFDFGDFESHYHNTWSQLMSKAGSKIADIKNRAEIARKQAKEHELTIQRNRIADVREGLLDLIFQINVDDHHAQISLIKQKMERPEKLMDELVPVWDQMIVRVKQSLDQKIQMIDQQLSIREQKTESRKRTLESIGFGFRDDHWTFAGFRIGRRELLEMADDKFNEIVKDIELTKKEIREQNERTDARTKQLTDLGMESNGTLSWFLSFPDDDFVKVSQHNVEHATDDDWNEIISNIESSIAENKIHNQRWDARKPLLKKNGFEYHERDQKFRHHFPGIVVALETVLTNGDESWKLVMEDLAKEIKTAKSNDAKEKSRQESLAGDKELLISYLINENSFTLKTTGIKNDEMAELAIAIRKEFDQWMDSKIEQIKNF